MKSILLVDDEYRVCDALARQLFDYELETAGDGQQAIDLLKKRSFDLVISDVRMPGVDGLELATWLHENQPQVPVILLSGMSGEEHALDFEVFRVLQKPLFQRGLLLETVEAALGESSA